MKKSTIIISILSTMFTVLLACSSLGQKDSNLPDKLIDIPTGLEVKHSDTIVYAIINEKDPDKYGKYKWHFETTVTAISEDLKIVEFGAYLWLDNEWVLRTIYDRPFNQVEFEKWYSCESALLKKGQSCTDKNNWSKAHRLEGQKTKALWYFIGVNANDDKFKGTAEITTIGELKK